MGGGFGGVCGEKGVSIVRGGICHLKESKIGNWMGEIGEECTNV